MTCQEKINQIIERNKIFEEQKKLSLAEFFALPEFDEYREMQKKIYSKKIKTEKYEAIKPCNIQINKCERKSDVFTDFTGGI